MIPLDVWQRTGLRGQWKIVASALCARITFDHPVQWPWKFSGVKWQYKNSDAKIKLNMPQSDHPVQCPRKFMGHAQLSKLPEGLYSNSQNFTPWQRIGHGKNDEISHNNPQNWPANREAENLSSRLLKAACEAPRQCHCHAILSLPLRLRIL